ncbi:MAG: ComF family protein [Alphaproteobacteria bacterium]|nr:MAG: ComF family protein [Alphaproteobacteria bacterium]
MCRKKISSRKEISQKILDIALSPGKDKKLIVTANFSYRGLIRDFIMLLKYRKNPHVAKFMTELMYPLIDTPGSVIFCPVPAHPLRLVSRGYNQSMELAKEMAQRFHQGTVVDALVRRRNTPQQKKKTFLKRYQNIHNAIGLRPNAHSHLMRKDIILLDDVCTSGATLVECAKVLLTDGGVANVKACVFALATKKDPNSYSF